MTRLVSATVHAADGTPREGLRVDFHADPPAQSTYAICDAGGTFRADLEPGITYLVPSTNPFTVNGVPYPAGITFQVQVPEGEGPADLSEVAVGILDLSPIALHRRIAALEQAAAIPTPEPEPAPEGTGAPKSDEGVTP